MFNPTARRQALLASLCLTIFAQQPIVPADRSLTASAAAGPAAILGGSGLSARPSMDEIAGTSTVYDANQKQWKRWFLEVDRPMADDGTVLRMATSTDGTNWTSENVTCFETGSSENDWDHSTISNPTVVINPNASPDRRFMLWYSGSNERGLRSNGLAESNIGVAFSADGQHFERVSAAESPYQTPGLAMSVIEAFPENAEVVEGCLGEPRVTLRDGKYSMSFYKIGNNASGQLLSAGIARAISSDGIKWTLECAPCVTVQVVGTHSTNSGLVERLKQLANAYYEAPI